MILTREMANKAIELTLPLVQALMDAGVTNRQHLHIHVAIPDPNSRTEQRYRTVAEHSIGITDWKNPYNEIAHAKSNLSARTGLSTREVQFRRPELLAEDDVMYYGNTVCGDFIVSCSGVQPWMDEVISIAVANVCRGLIQSRLVELRDAANGFRYKS